MEDKILRIGSILNLSSTTSRESAVKSLIENTLYSYNETLTFKELVELINDTFNIKPFENEIKDVVDKAIKIGEIVTVDGRYKLSSDKYLDIQKKDVKNEEENNIRLVRFDILCGNVVSLQKDEIQLLWNSFNEYIYECFYQYGENAVNHFRAPRPNTDYDNIVDANSFKNVINRIKTDELRAAFKKIIISFIQHIGHTDIEYLESLAKKTIAFHSLGLPKDLHTEIIDLDIIDWTIFVDTNFLFSILNLHIHPENEACNQLLVLVKNSNLKIKFKYTPFTLGELKRKKADFDDLIPKVNFERSHVSGLVKSGRLDGFSQAYYENLLRDSESTLHPSEIIDISERTIRTIKGIEVFNSKFENISDDYVNSKADDFQRYINMLNDIYREKDIDRQVYRSHKQLYHDVFLREVIEYLQRKTSEETPKTISEIKFLGVTLDKLLMKYDKSILGRETKDFITPNFYLPSFLLNKLYGLIPVQTEDYKKAFVTAIATFSFFESNEKSRDVQRFVNYFRNQGLNDERLLLSFITDEFFLNKFFNEETEKDSFFESEVNKKFLDVQTKYEEAEKRKGELEHSQAVTLEEKERQEYYISNQQALIDQIKDSERVLSISLKKIQQKKPKDVRLNKQLNLLDIIGENELKSEVSNLKTKLAERDYKDEMEKYVNEKWQLQQSKRYKWMILFLIWLPVPICYYIVNRICDPNLKLNIYLPVLTSLASVVISFLNKEDIMFSFKYLFNSTKTREHYIKRLSKEYKIDHPQI